MPGPVASPLYIPVNGKHAVSDGAGLLPWDWVLARLTASDNYWLATVWPDGRPHLMPIWVVWHADAAWFSSSERSRKARNLAVNPRAAITTENPREPVVVEGEVSRISDVTEIEQFAKAVNDKYGTGYPVEFFTANACFRLQPATVYGLTQRNEFGAPTRWIFT